MKVKTLLRVLKKVEYCITAESGWTIEDGYIDERGYDPAYDATDVHEREILEVTTVTDCDTLFIRLKGGRLG